MTVRSRSLHIVISCLIIFAMGLAGFAVTAKAATAKRAATSKPAAKSSIPKRCKTRNKAKGTIKYSDWQFPSNLNPIQNSEAVASLTEDLTSDSLYLYDQSSKLKPDMLSVLPTLKNGGITNGGKTITLHLKKGMQWSNGTEITSGDVKFGWKVDMNKDTGPACAGSCDQISRIDTPDKYTAILHLKKIFAPAVPNAFPGVIPQKWTTSAGGWAKGDSAKAANLIGQVPTFNYEDKTYPTNGPYQVTEWVKDNRIVLKPMKYYNILSCGAYAANMIFVFYSEKASMIAGASNHETDVTQNYTLFDLAELAKHAGSFKLHNDPAFQIEHLEFNLDPQYNGKANPFANVKVRQAVSLAIERLNLIRSALSVNTAQAKAKEAASTFIYAPGVHQPYADPNLKGQWDPITKKYVEPGSAAAVNDAKKLMSQSPYASGFDADFYTTAGNPVRAAQESVIALDLKKIGINVKPNFVPASKLFGEWDQGGVLHHGAYQIGMFAFVYSSPEPDGSKYNFQSQYVDRDQSTHASLNGNDAGIRDKVIDKAFETGAHSFDPKVRKAAYYTVQIRTNQLAYWFPLYYRPNIATSDAHVQNFKNTPVGEVTWNTFEWKPKNA